MRFEGFLSEEDLIAAFTAADVFVLPSEWEAFGIVLLEAMACRTPCICSDLGGPPEVVVDGETGFLVAPEDPPALAEALQWLREHRKQAWAMGIAGRERAQRLFSREAFLRDYQEVLDDTLVGV